MSYYTNNNMCHSKMYIAISILLEVEHTFETYLDTQLLRSVLMEIFIFFLILRLYHELYENK